MQNITCLLLADPFLTKNVFKYSTQIWCCFVLCRRDTRSSLDVFKSIIGRDKQSSQKTNEIVQYKRIRTGTHKVRYEVMKYVLSDWCQACPGLESAEHYCIRCRLNLCVSKQRLCVFYVYLAHATISVLLFSNEIILWEVLYNLWLFYEIIFHVCWCISSQKGIFCLVSFLNCLQLLLFYFFNQFNISYLIWLGFQKLFYNNAYWVLFHI